MFYKMKPKTYKLLYPTRLLYLNYLFKMWQQMDKSNRILFPQTGIFKKRSRKLNNEKSIQKKSDNGTALAEHAHQMFHNFDFYYTKLLNN